MKIVLIGATNNPEKYGNKILKDLIKKGHTVYPVNPKEDFIEGIKTYKNILEIKNEFDIINFVVKPEITNQIIEKNKDIFINKKIWIQPGASNNETRNLLINNNFKDYIIDSCIMIPII